MNLTSCRSGLLAFGLVLAATPARADLVYPVSYVGAGVAFSCDIYLLANCSVSGGGSIVTLFNNGGSLTFQAVPASGSFVASSANSVTFPLVTFFSTVNGPFSALPPSPIGTNEPFFEFTVFFTWMTADGNSAAGFTGGFYRDPGNATGHFAVLGTQFAPPSSSLSNFSRVSGGVTSPPYITFGAANTSGTIFGSASIAPEPSTIVLSASGLGMLGLFARRRKRRLA